jgi:type IV pilus assembly protein PilB
VEAFASTNQVLTLARGKGCEKCRQRGYQGRICLFELLTMTHEIADLVVSGASQAEIAAARAAGMNSLWRDGLLKILDGITTPDEVLRACTAV